MKLKQELCKAFAERSSALDLKGKKRDDAAMHYFVGAAKVVQLSQGQDCEDYKVLASFITFSLMFQGYKAISEELDEETVKAKA